ncbi:MAG: MFS transporter [Chlamydiia bacterium]|nr:MFS transporter [Chlamydiia bacterium]
MGTILAVKKGKKICIAADSMSFSGDSTKQTADYISNYDKILEYRENYIGVVGGSYSSWPLLFNEFFLTVKPCAKLSSPAEIFQTFLNFHKELKEHYFLNPNEDDRDEFESSRFEALIVNPHGIFKVYQLRSVQQFSKFWAIG